MRDKDRLCTYPCSPARSLAKALLPWFVVTSKSVHRASDFSVDIISSSVQWRQLDDDWIATKLAELTHLGWTSAGCCRMKNCPKIFSPAAPAHWGPHLLISCAGLSSRTRPLLALSFIHIAAEARVSQICGGQVESTLLSPFRWQVTLF